MKRAALLTGLLLLALALLTACDAPWPLLVGPPSATPTALPAPTASISIPTPTNSQPPTPNPSSLVLTGHQGSLSSWPGHRMGKRWPPRRVSSTRPIHISGSGTATARPWRHSPAARSYPRPGLVPRPADPRLRFDGRHCAPLGGGRHGERDDHPGGRGVFAVAWAPDGQTLATGSLRADAMTRPSRSGRSMVRREPPSRPGLAAASSTTWAGRQTVPDWPAARPTIASGRPTA